MTITSRFASRTGCGDDRSAVTSNTNRAYIPKQSLVPSNSANAERLLT